MQSLRESLRAIWFPLLTTLFVVGIAYFLAARFGVAFIVQPEQIAVFWPANGLLLGVLLLLPRTRWWIVLLGAFLGCLAANLVVGKGFVVATLFSLINVIETLLGALLLSAFRSAPAMVKSSAELFYLFLLPGLVVCKLTGFLAALAVRFDVPEIDLLAVWKTWWLADALGVMIFTPFVLLGCEAIRQPTVSKGKQLESGLWLVLNVVVTGGLLLLAQRLRLDPLLLFYFLVPWLLIVAMRTGRFGASLAVVGIALVGVPGIIHAREMEHFLPLSSGDRVLLVQGILAVFCFFALVLATTLDQQLQQAAAIDRLNHSLTEEVQRSNAREQRFRAIVDSTYQYIGLLSPDGTILEANRTALDGAGVTAEQVVGVPFWEAIWWKHNPKLQVQIQDGIARALEGAKVRFEADHPLADGTLARIDFSLTPIRDETGKVILLVPKGHDVTYLKRTEDELRESRERYELALSASQEGIWDWDLGTNTVFFSPRWKGMLGYGEEEVSNDFSEWKSRVHPDDLSRAEATIAAYLEGHIPVYDVEFRMRHRDGNWLWIRTRGVLQRNSEGKPIRLTGSHVDITRRKEIEAELAAREALLEQFIATAPAAIAMLDTEMRYLQTSRRWLSDYHLEGVNVIGRSHYEVFPDIPEEWKAIHRRVLKGDRDRCEEMPFHRANGETEWLQWEVLPWRNAQCEIGGIVMYTQVITERKRFDAALRDSEERFRGAFDNAPIGMALVAPDGRWLKVNRSICQILGYSETELLQTDFQSLTYPDDLEPDWVQARRVLSGEIESYQIEKRYFHKSGGIIHALLLVSLVRDEAGKPLYFVSQIKDITEQKQSERKMLASLQEKEVMLREIHHRVKNNLAIISSLFQLQLGQVADPLTQQLLRDAQDRVRSMALVHEQLYNSDNLAAICFHEYARSLADEILNSYRLSDEGVELRFEIQPVMLSINQAIPCGLLLNELLTNCLKHAFLPGIRGAITIDLKDEAGVAHLSVRDTGRGLPLEPESAKPRSLGMKLIHSLSRQLGGKMEYDSRPTGTEAKLVFPIEISHP
jgi:PAS domain S-box-containing protein